jgi:uncharacterized protein
MQFLVIAHDYKDGLSRRLAARPEHLSLIEQLRRDGRCLYAARLLNEDGSGSSVGSVMVFDYASRQDLDEMLADEPYTAGKVWEKIEIAKCEVAASFLQAPA